MLLAFALPSMCFHCYLFASVCILRPFLDTTECLHLQCTTIAPKQHQPWNWLSSSSECAFLLTSAVRLKTRLPSALATIEHRHLVRESLYQQDTLMPEFKSPDSTVTHALYFFICLFRSRKFAWTIAEVSLLSVWTIAFATSKSYRWSTLVSLLWRTFPSYPNLSDSNWVTTGNLFSVFEIIIVWSNLHLLILQNFEWPWTPGKFSRARVP